jgi:O-antigen/teichoic acid export membrane protein
MGSTPLTRLSLAWGDKGRRWPGLLRLWDDQVARNSVYVLSSQASLMLLQAIQFLLLARALGSDEFGRFASVAAITSALAPFSSLGLGNVAILRISRGEGTPHTSFGNALMVTAIAGVICLGGALLIGPAALRQPGTWLLILLLGLSELLLAKCVDMTANVFFGLEKHGIAMLLYNLQMAGRTLSAAVLYWAWTHPTALDWAQLHVISGVLTATIALCVGVRLIGTPQLQLASALSGSKIGVFFSLMFSARSVQADADKAILARDAGTATAGAYTAAFRLAYLVCLPVMAVQTALQNRTFRAGHTDGLTGAMTVLRRLVVFGGLYCVVLGIAMYWSGPVVPWLLGESYRQSTEILHWLCLLPLLIVTQTLCSDALSSVNAQHRVAFWHSAAAAIVIALNLVLVPRFGWQGSVLATYATQCFLVVGLVAAMVILNRATGEPSHEGS